LLPSSRPTPPASNVPTERNGRRARRNRSVHRALHNPLSTIDIGIAAPFACVELTQRTTAWRNTRCKVLSEARFDRTLAAAPRRTRTGTRVHVPFSAASTPFSHGATRHRPIVYKHAVCLHATTRTSQSDILLRTAKQQTNIPPHRNRTRGASRLHGKTHRSSSLTETVQ
jgi:hypothetical protein